MVLDKLGMNIFRSAQLKKLDKCPAVDKMLAFIFDFSFLFAIALFLLIKNMSLELNSYNTRNKLKWQR